MKNQTTWQRTLVIAAVSVAFLLTASGAAVAQPTTGNLYGTVTDIQGQTLPGVTVTLSCEGTARKIQVTNAEGKFRFIGLHPGTCKLVVDLEGLPAVEYPNLLISLGRDTTIECVMSPAGAPTTTVITASSLPDDCQVTTGVNVPRVELDKIPTARDPWVILQSVPGVLVDRINIGGNESGQQSNFVSNGVTSSATTWTVDGVVVTDPAARGASSSYYNFDAFEEMWITNGGTDMAALTAGVQLNMVTKRGTGDWRVSGRYFLTDSSWEAASDVGDLGEPGPWNAFNSPSGSTQGNRTDQVDDWGADLGGPIVKGKLWIWGSYSFQDIDTFVLGGSEPVPDNTELENYAAKINAQLAASNSLVAFYHFGDKLKFGRGAAPTRPRETTWNQDGPTDIWKLEDTHIFSSNLYVTGMYSYVGGGFALAPVGGLTCATCRIVRGPDRVWRNSFFDYSTDRPLDHAKIDGSYFFKTGGVDHELKFGVGYRLNEVRSASLYPVDNIVGRADIGLFGGTPSSPTYLALAYHDSLVNDEFEQWSAILQDTLTLGSITVDAGLRYDLQSPTQLTYTRPGNPTFPNAIEPFTREGGDPGFEWETISPRVGITYGLGDECKTLLRASYSRFADQLGTGFFTDLGVSTTEFGYLYWYDRNTDLIIQDDEIGPIFATAGAPGTPSANQVDPGLDPMTTDEIRLAVEHAVLPDLVIGLSATIRQNRDFVVDDPFVVDQAGTLRRVQRGDYVLAGNLVGTLPYGQEFSEPVYRLADGVDRDPAGGFFRYNSDYEQEYFGLSLNFTKRLSSNWSLRGHITYADWTNEGINAASDPDPTRGVNDVNGSQVLTQSAGSGTRGEIWLNSQYSANISGVYQVAPSAPWGFNVAADINYREGFPIPYRVSVSGSSGLVDGDRFTRTVLVSPENDSFRNDDVLVVNARVEKEFTFSSFGLTVGIDAFNLFDNQDVLQREGVINATGVRTDGRVFSFPSTNGDFARETIAPRILRLGARFSW